MIRFNVLVASVLLFGGLSLQAAEIEGFCNLPAPPAPGSAEFQKDLDILHRYQLQRTAAQCEVAASQRHVSLRSWFGPGTGILTDKEVRRASAVALTILAIHGARVAACKNHFKRNRPYVQDLTIKPCIEAPKATHLSYPSGHASVSAALAQILARMFPAKAKQIIAQGYQIGMNRALSGVHFPSDVQAGWKLSRVIVQDFDKLYFLPTTNAMYE